MNILHIDSSVAGEKSVSRPLSKAAAVKLAELNPGANVIYRDLIANPLRHYTAVLRTYGADAPNLSPDQQAELKDGEEILAEFLAADVIVIGAPMYNFSIPSQLKAWIDLIAVPGKTFRYGPAGPEGLCAGKRVVIISTRGGLYGPGSPRAAFDFQENYLKAVFHFTGTTDIQIIRAEGVGQAGMIDQAVAAAKQQISELK